ncbi:lymphocyte antigen 6K [Desmodus rotundus]|uniref:lymphocyte antigen 6K n=1 Tax=Desmodus rotundus TaxID=9430 RepID=UPI001E1BE6C5|nr:lymphocyte antigen 6K isoform X2 [Desmodus rotundus]XP_053786363.1 lymphocyte antigen 6K isoform X2 [Desmodus rotundus]
MLVFLALLLVMGLLRVETNLTVTGRQREMNCHVCEKENDFGCLNPRNCPANTEFCSTAAVRLFPRFFFVSKQCAKYCPVFASSAAAAESFVLEKPTPFIYVRCCRGPLCNTESPNVTEYREAGRAHEVQSGSAGLALFLALSSVSLGLRLS